jgi:hypothetical protein
MTNLGTGKDENDCREELSEASREGPIRSTLSRQLALRPDDQMPYCESRLYPWDERKDNELTEGPRAAGKVRYCAMRVSGQRRAARSEKNE